MFSGGRGGHAKLTHYLRRWPNFKQKLGKLLVFIRQVWSSVTTSADVWSQMKQILFIFIHLKLWAAVVNENCSEWKFKSDNLTGKGLNCVLQCKFRISVLFSHSTSCISISTRNLTDGRHTHGRKQTSKCLMGALTYLHVGLLSTLVSTRVCSAPKVVVCSIHLYGILRETCAGLESTVGLFVARTRDQNWASTAAVTSTNGMPMRD